MADNNLSEGERLNLVQNAILSKVNALLDMFPGYRGYRRGVENAIRMAQGEPNNYSVDEYAKDLGYSMVPFYGAYDDYMNDRPQDWTRNLIEASLVGIPLPYTKYPVGHPKAGEAIPNNLKEALSEASWRSTKSGWRTGNNARKLYADPTKTKIIRSGDELAARGTADRRMSTRYQINANQEVRDPLTEGAVVGPFNRGGTVSDVVNTEGTNMLNTNRAAYGERNHGRNTGAQSYQGEMYDPRRQPIDYNDYGPFAWEADPYASKLNNVINEQENKWNFLINETRPDRNGRRPIPKEEGMRIALEQGRPDIADRIASDTEPRITIAKGPKYTSYYTRVTKDYKNEPNPREKFMDVSNRAVEKELREFIGAYADNPVMFEKIANHYGLKDILEDYAANPEKWLDFQKEVKYKRYQREAVNARHDKLYRRNNQ